MIVRRLEVFDSTGKDRAASLAAWKKAAQHRLPCTAGLAKPGTAALVPRVPHARPRRITASSTVRPR